MFGLYRDNRYSESRNKCIYQSLKAVRKIAVTDEREQRRLFDTYCNYVGTIVFNRLRSCAGREDMEECLCDVFAEVYLHYDSEKAAGGSEQGFIGTVARRKAAAYYRRAVASERTESGEELLNAADPAADTERELESRELRSMLLDKIAELGEPDSTIIMQKYYYGRSAREIAAMTSLTPENIRVRSGRAVRKLGEMLEKAGISL
ncbi:MAG: sigma-70 family RNA polymerase sigma factor [Ruminococcus sp.]|nr:sigma-70 family RNA polymerase sigma factor [Ruminococcus sp.]